MTEDVQGIAEVEPLTRWLSENVPESPAPTIVHNDYKLYNLILDPDNLTEVRAVLDWEMTTIGDPLVDLGASLSYWIEPDDPEDLKEVLPTVVGSKPGFLTRSEFVDLYAERSRRDVSNVRFYLAFGYFRLAAIVQQIYARWQKGQTKDERFASFEGRVCGLVKHAALTRSDSL